MAKKSKEKKSVFEQPWYILPNMCLLLVGFDMLYILLNTSKTVKYETVIMAILSFAFPIVAILISKNEKLSKGKKENAMLIFAVVEIFVLVLFIIWPFLSIII